MILYKIVYWLGMIIEVVVRAPFQKTAREGVKTERRVSPIENILLGLMTVVMLILPLIYTLTHWLDFANYRLPVWLGWTGVFILAASVLIFWRAHMDLQSNWSPSLEIRQDQTLVTEGIYRTIRHPFYASQLLWVIAQILLMQNGLAGLLGLVFFIPFYFLRVRAEEKLMLDAFGSRYREYMEKVGGIIPKASRFR